MPILFTELGSISDINIEKIFEVLCKYIIDVVHNTGIQLSADII